MNLPLPYAMLLGTALPDYPPQVCPDVGIRRFRVLGKARKQSFFCGRSRKPGRLASFRAVAVHASHRSSCLWHPDERQAGATIPRMDGVLSVAADLQTSGELG